MPRDFEALYRAQAQARTSTVQNETLSLPPGYLVGYDVRLRQDYTVLITAGACNIGGRLVQLKDDHQLVDADWVAPKINSARHYYIYLSAAGAWFVDIVAPVWNNQYLYYEQPDTNWRAVGKIFLADGQIIFGIKEVEKNEQTVTVAPAGFTGRADYYCTGTDDQILINAAIRYLHEAYDGGQVNTLYGEYAITASIIPYSNITLSFTGSVLTTTQDISIIDINAVFNVNIYDGVFRATVGQQTPVIYLQNPGGMVSTYKPCSVRNAKIYGDGTNGVGIRDDYYYTVVDGCYCADLYTGFRVGSNASVRDCTAYSNNNAGYLVVGIYSLVTTCYAGLSTTYGIIVNGATSAQIIGNFCENNGSDTGIANTNSNNFYDGGTDTQVYSNSWQQPVAGEPTQGELKWLPQSTNTISGYLLVGVTTTAVWSSASVGTIVPVGAKSLFCTVQIQASSSGAGNFTHIVKFSNSSSGTPAIGTYQPEAGFSSQAAAAGDRYIWVGTTEIPLTTDRKFYHYARTRFNASACTLTLTANGYKI